MEFHHCFEGIMLNFFSVKICIVNKLMRFFLQFKTGSNNNLVCLILDFIIISSNPP
jgi:hypothetical protein